LLDCSAILLANSLTVISSGIFISRFIGFEFSSISSLVKSLFSLSLALLRDAKLLALVSISSLKALDTVNFNSLFFVPALPFSADSLLSHLVALCSANLRFS